MIHYIGFYTHDSEFRGLNIAPSALTKMNYIVNVLLDLYGKVHVFSPAYSHLRKYSWFKRKKLIVHHKLEITYGATFSSPWRILRLFAQILSCIELFIYLIRLKDDDIVIVYHSLGIPPWLVKLAKSIRKFQLIYEIEEIYNAVYKNDRRIYSEISALNFADAYIYVNSLMNSLFNYSKPYVVCCGEYNINSSDIKRESKTLLYAGVIADSGSDVYLAIDALRYLPNYKLIIAGYGSSLNLQKMKDFISENSDLNIEYVGCLSGISYTNLLNSCTFGLCTRVLDNKYSDFTFPSKILVYMSNGLKPVVPKLRCLESSVFSSHMIYFEELSGESVANTILKSAHNKIGDPRLLVSVEDNIFRNKLKRMISN